ncbi:MAG: serine protease [Candidatus Nitrosotenuis sp.]|nr:MAG: serine protease [Candidatus Nitrosotenuis sp.]
MPDPINDEWMNATVKIVNQDGKTGTGFLINNGSKKFLITNKHVLHKEQTGRESATMVDLHLNVFENGNIVGKQIQFPLQNGSTKLWNEHPDPDVDVLVIDVTTICGSITNLATRPMISSLICTKTQLQRFNIINGRKVIVLGYPLTIMQAGNNRPLRISGAIASDIGNPVSYPRFNSVTSREEQKIIRGFVIESNARSGSSGSPVILEPMVNFFGGEQDTIGKPLPPLLLGIISEERLAVIQAVTGDELASSHLIVVYDAETILDVINLF